MNKLEKDIETLIYGELVRDIDSNGKTHNSPHESFGVIRDMLDRAVRDCDAVEVFIDSYWMAVKTNEVEDQRKALVALFEKSMLASSEFIKVSAIAIKSIYSLNGGKQDE